MNPLIVLNSCSSLSNIRTLVAIQQIQNLRCERKVPVVLNHDRAHLGGVLPKSLIWMKPLGEAYV